MRIFKFGGASVKDANGVKNLVKVLNTVGYENTLLVVSAMGKTTNAFEKVVKNYLENNKELQSSIQEIKKFHNEILLDLFENETHSVFKKIESLFNDISVFFDRNKSPDYDFIYDQVVSYGELISTTILSTYLPEKGIPANWLDARECIKTDSTALHTPGR